MKSIVSCVFSTLLVCALTSTAFAQEDEPVGPGTGEGTLPTPPPAETPPPPPARRAAAARA